jgi:hypothetical protein
MNQISKIILGHFKDGNRIISVLPEPARDAKKIIVHLSDGTSHEHEVKTNGHGDFMEQWKQAVDLFAIRWGGLD